jgi:hypothetical protein
VIQTLFPNNDAVYQDDNAPIHTAGTVQSWSEENEGELQHFPWLAHSPELKITEPLWSVLETRVRIRFLPPTSLKKLVKMFFKKENSARNCSKLVQVHSKRDCGCTEGKR